MPPSALFLTKTVTLQRPTFTRDAAGGKVPAWAAVANATDLPAAVQPLTSHARLAYAARQIEATHAVYLGADPGLRRGDRLAVSDGRYLLAEGALDAGGAGRLYKLPCREVFE
jgi:head-tail adaptor